MLEHSEQTQYLEELKKENEVLGSYDWVDQKNGVVRIPIDRAMDLLAQRGLPVVSPSGCRARGRWGQRGRKPECKGCGSQKAKATKGQQ